MYNQMLKTVNQPLWKSQLIPVTVLQAPEARDTLSQETRLNLPEFEEIQDAMDFLAKDINDVYLTKNPYMPFVYFKSPVFVPIDEWDRNYLEMLIKPQLDARSQKFNELVAEKKFSELFGYLDERVAFEIYQDLFTQIPDEQKYELFEYVYSQNEYGFGELSKDFVKKAFSYKDRADKRKIKLPAADTQGNVKIYRGMTSESTPLENAYSWTTNFSVACYFAQRFSSHGNIYAAEIPLSKIITYITARNEFEVLVDPEDLIHPQILSVLTLENCPECEIAIQEANVYTSKINEKYFELPQGDHGVGHTIRVLILSLMLGVMENLAEEDKRILAFASVYHDIGRGKNEGKDKEHGYASFRKTKKLGLLKKLNPKEAEIIRYLIENHCIDDKDAIAHAKDYLFSNKKHAISLLKLFKDADGLDRVRFGAGGHLDLKFLRTPKAKEMVYLTQELYQKSKI